MNKLTGYILAIVGLVVVLLSFNLSKLGLTAIKQTYALLIGLVLVAVGVFFVMSKGTDQAAEEVPIYHGKKIVGYRRQK